MNVMHAVKTVFVFLIKAKGFTNKSRWLRYLWLDFVGRFAPKYNPTGEFFIECRDARFWYRGKSFEINPYIEIFVNKDYGYISDFIPHNDWVIIDAGANIELYTIWASRYAPNGKILAIEPNPDVFSRLVKNVKANKLPAVKCINKALDNHLGKAVLISDRHSGLGSIMVEAGLEKGDRDSSRISVDTTTLDQIVAENKLSRVDLLKLDVEGAELRVLEGGHGAALDIIDRVVLECHSYDLHYQVNKFLGNRGFTLVGRKYAEFERPSIDYYMKR